MIPLSLYRVSAERADHPDLLALLDLLVVRDSLVPREMLERMVLREMLVLLDPLDPLVLLDLRFIYLCIQRTLKHY